MAAAQAENHDDDFSDGDDPIDADGLDGNEFNFEEQKMPSQPGGSSASHNFGPRM